MNIILTGSAGFIGAAVAQLLIKKGYKVYGIDNLNDSYDVKLKNWRLDNLLLNSNFSFTKLDITNFEELDSYFSKFTSGTKPDALINLAARAGVRASISNPHIYYNTNVIGTINLLELSNKYGISKFIQASTSSVYGNLDKQFKEDQITDFPCSPYAASKKSAENFCYTYHKIYGIDITVLRYFTVYGPAGRPDMSPFRFIRWIYEGDEIVLYGDGNQVRDFTYVDDIARGTVLGLKELGYEIINLGNDNPISIKELIKTIEKKTKRKATVVSKSMHPADVNATWANISKAKDILGWAPKVSLNKGIEESINWYEENRRWAKKIDCAE